MANKVYSRKCCRKRTSSSPDWYNIDSDLFEYIQKKMSFADTLQCRAICKSWRYLTEAHIQVSLNSPVLMLQKQYLLPKLNLQENYFEPYRGSPCCFLNVAGKRLYKLSDKSREALRSLKRFVGSSHGWVLFMDRKYDFCMFNPSFDACARLEFDMCLYRFRILKAVLWSDPVLSSNSGAVFLCKVMTREKRLFFAKNGDSKCRHLMRQADSSLDYHDIICFQSCVYGVTEKGSIQSWDFNTLTFYINRYVPKLVLDFQPRFDEGKEYREGSKFHLVESVGELLLVSRSGSESVSFQVYKLDFEGRKWVSVDSLGDRVVFLTGNQCLSFSAREFPGFQSNSIYFEHEVGHGSGGPGVYVYSLDGGDLKQIYL